MSNFGLSCDVCNRENVGITWVNGMKFCAKCYQETFGNKNMIENLNNMYDAYLKLLNEKDQRIAELEEQLKNVIMLPKNLQVGNKIFWANEDSVYCGKVCSITKDENPRGGFNIWFYCIYDNGLTFWHLLKDFNSEVFTTKEEAEAKLKELRGE